MKTQTLQNAVLIGSLMINVVLIAGVLWLGTSWKQELLEIHGICAEEKWQLQKGILEELESKDPARIEALKKALKFKIDVEGRVAYKLRTNVPMEE